MRTIAAGLAALVVAAGAVPRAQFRDTVDVVEVTATVTDGRGRFLTGCATAISSSVKTAWLSA